MKIEKWIELLVGGIILVGLGWLLAQVFDMKGILSSVDSKLTATSDRVERIAAALPDLRIKIATEEISKPIQAAVVTTEPVKNTSGNWIAAVHVINSVAGERQTYVVNLKGPDDKRVAYLVSGIASAPATEAVSFLDLERFSSEIGKPVSAPSYVLSDRSFVIRKFSPEYTKALEKTLGVSPKTSLLTSKLPTWDKLSAELKDNPSRYKPQ